MILYVYTLVTWTPEVKYCSIVKINFSTDQVQILCTYIWAVGAHSMHVLCVHVCVCMYVYVGMLHKVADKVHNTE